MRIDHFARASVLAEVDMVDIPCRGKACIHNRDMAWDTGCRDCSRASADSSYSGAAASDCTSWRTNGDVGARDCGCHSH